eukprot:PhF_6_TR21943/c0_g1_i1/m.31188/K08824/CDKL; cyclin-dependent kinase-like
MEMYETIGLLGEGTYGVVVKAIHKETQQLVAIKKFKESEDDEHVRKTSIREIRMLKNLRHFNIVNLLDVFRRRQKLYLVFEFIDRTILELVEKKQFGLDEHEVKKYTYQLLRAVEFCHRNGVIHRDIKPENILINKNGTLKLCDFGFARALGGAGAKYTEYVATRWYRSPELLVGDEYGRPVDIWAIGCIFAEISNGMPLFPGESDLDQLHHIIRCFGRLVSRHEQSFRRNKEYAGIELPAPKSLEPLEDRFNGSRFTKVWLSFLKACLKNDPDARETCPNLLNHPYFTDKGFKQTMEEELERLEAQERVQNSWWRTSDESTKPTTAPRTPATLPPPTPPSMSECHPLPVIGNGNAGVVDKSVPTRHTNPPLSMFTGSRGGVGTSGLFSQDYSVISGVGVRKNSTPSTPGLPTLGTMTTDVKMSYKKKNATSLSQNLGGTQVTPPSVYGMNLYNGSTTILHPGGSMKAPSTSHQSTRDPNGGSRKGSKTWDMGSK